MRQIIILVLVGTLALVLTPPTAVSADQVFHSKRLSFSLTAAGEVAGHPEVRSAHVVDIHPNGPVNGAFERYLINGAASETSYRVILQVFNGGCEGEFLFPLQTTTLTTNAQGNAHGKVAFTPQDLAPFSGLVFGVQWTLVDEDGVRAYETPCIVVAVD